MNEFYDSLSENERAFAPGVALKYGRTVNSYYQRLLNAKAASNRPYYVGLSSDMGSFEQVTKRVVLVADTVLLSEHGVGAVHELGMREWTSTWPASNTYGADVPDEEETQTWRYGMVTEDLAKLGQRLLDAEPLLRSGAVWYGPVFVEGTVEGLDL
ncbi:hypothetical protein ACWERI_39175 [Streptomyces collinus]